VSKIRGSGPPVAAVLSTLGLIPAAGSDERSTPLKGLFFTVGCGMLSSG